MGSIPAAGEEKVWCQNMLSLVSFAGMTLNKCAVLRIGTLTGSSLCRESHPLCRLKNPTVVYMLTCRLSSCKISVFNVHLFIILEKGCSSMYRKKKWAWHRSVTCASLSAPPRLSRNSVPRAAGARCMLKCPLCTVEKCNSLSPYFLYRLIRSWSFK